MQLGIDASFSARCNCQSHGTLARRGRSLWRLHACGQRSTVRACAARNQSVLSTNRLRLNQRVELHHVSDQPQEPHAHHRRPHQEPREALVLLHRRDDEDADASRIAAGDVRESFA